MSVYAITGKLGSGKSLVSVGRIMTYLAKGRRVASNLDLHLDRFFGQRSRVDYLRLPDFPLIADLNMIGVGNDSLDESKNGLLVLDEVGVFLNSRDWDDKTRKAIIAWLLHSRKLGWDVILIVQDVSLIDKQIRCSLLEHVGVCKRTDRLRIPFIGGLLKFLGLPYRPPRMHMCSIKYGVEIHALIVDRWFYRGAVIQNCYDTRQVFTANYAHGLYTVLSPWLVTGRYLQPTFFMRCLAFLRGSTLQKPRVVELKPKLPDVLKMMQISDQQERWRVFHENSYSL